MTKYILNSGGPKNNPEKAARFFREIVSGLSDAPRLLSGGFAQPREDWEKKFQIFRESWTSLSEIRPVFELAMPETFVEQVKRADIIYLHGGDDILLQHWLKKFSLPDIWPDKVVAASSAGSSALAKHFWTCDWRQNMDGLGILPIKFLPHFRSNFGADDPRGPIDWDKAYRDLEEYGDQSLPIHALEEGDYIVIEK